MKRVERRGTLDNASLPTLPHHIAPHPPLPQPPTHSRSSQHSPPHPGPDRSVHRSDTIPAGQGVGPGGTQLLSFTNRDQQSSLRASPSSFSRTSGGGGGAGSSSRRSPAHGSIRSQPSPPAIATLQPDSEDTSVHASSPETLTIPPPSRIKNGHSKSSSRRGSRRPSPNRGSSSSPLDSSTIGPKHIERRPPSAQSIPSGGSGSPPPHLDLGDNDADADGEPEPEPEQDAVADPDLDPQAGVDPLTELQDAVDAAEANSSGSGSQWLKKEDT